jgi:hypothetical protein
MIVKEIRTAADADSIRGVIESILDGWYTDRRVDFVDLFDRLEQGDDYDLGDSLLSPAVGRIKGIVREWRKENPC